MKIKSLFAIAAMALLTVNCVQEEAGPLETTVKVEAVMENELSTKTNVDQTGYFTWAEGDQIGIHTNAGDLLVGKLNKDSHGQSKGVFSYTVIGDAPVLSGVAVYPYNDGHVIADDKLTFVMPAEYNLGAVYTNTNAAMLAMNPVKKDGSASYSFSHLAGVMRFEFKNAPVGTSKFTLSLGGKKINGAFEVDLSNPVITTGEATDEQKTTTLNFTALEEVQNLVLFVPVPAGEYTGIEAKLYAGEEELGKWGAATAKNDIKKRSLVLMAAITFGEVPGGIENNVNVATAKQLTEAVAKGGTITLTEDISLSEILVISKNTTLDGNGHKITSSAGRAINVSGAEDVTIKNLTIVASGERAINVIQNTKKVTIDNVIATSANYTVNVASSAPGAEVVINKSVLTGLNVVNVASPGANVTLTDCTVNCNDKTPAEGYAALTLNKDAVEATITATDCVVNIPEGSGSVMGSNGALGGQVTINGSTDGVDVMVAAISYGNNYYAFNSLAAAVDYAKNGETVQLLRDVEIDADNTIKISKDKTLVIDLNGFTVAGVSDQVGANRNLFHVSGEVIVKNGKITLKHEGTNMGWNNSTNIFHIEGPGVLNVLDAELENQGGSDMAFAVHLNNWGGDLGLNIENSTLKSTYMAVRVFNSGPYVNNVTIKNSTLEGAKYAFWVHNYTLADFGNNADKTAAQQNLLNLDIYGNGNTFIASVAAVRFGFTDSIYFNADGVQQIADGVTMSPEGYYLVANEAGLRWVADQVNTGVNTFAGKTVKLTADVTLTKEWTPIGCSAKWDDYKSFRGKFDGGNYTIKNMNVSADEFAGFIGVKHGSTAEAGVYNLKFDNATVNGSHYGAVVVAWADGAQTSYKQTISNCHVTNSTVTLVVKDNDNGDKAGAIAGYFYACDMDNCSVANTTIKGYRDLGGLVGMLQQNNSGEYSSLANSTVGDGVKVIVDNSNNYQKYNDNANYNVGNFAGRVASNCTITGCTGSATLELPYQKSVWAINGDFEGSGNWVDRYMVTTADPDVVVVKSVELKEAQAFLVRKPSTDYADKYGASTVNYIKANHYITTAKDGSDLCVEAAGTYDIYFNVNTKAIYVMTSGIAYATATEQTSNGKEPVQEKPEVTDKTIYLKPNANWKVDNARFAAYFFGNGETWVSMTDSDADGIYEVNLPVGFDYGCNVIFCRMNGSTTANNWNNKWNQTSDLKVPTDGKNLYTVKDGTWDKGGGTWSTKK